MALFNNLSIQHYPVLGINNNATYKKIDLSVDGDVAKQHSENWYQYLSKLPVTKPEEIYYGGYLEKRFFYSNENLFGSDLTKRDIHLGVDLWVPEQTAIHAPLDGFVHSISYNNSDLDYGHTIILRHTIQDQVLYSLYGHLSKTHLKTLKANMPLRQGEIFCTIGGHGENGGWPPHLHLQLMLDLGDYIGDYPGVSSIENLQFYQTNCPDPSSLIQKG